LWCVFIVIQLLTLVFSKDIAGSIQKLIVAQITWTGMLFAGAYIFRTKGRIKRWAMVVWAMAIFVSLIAVWESRIQHVPWRDHIPSFLQINDDTVLATLAGSARAFTGRYRAQATFGTSLGLAEYLVLALPFVLHFTTRRFSKKTRVAAMISIPMLLVGAYLTDAKLGIIGSLLSIFLYVFVAALQNWRRNKASVMAAIILFLYPLSLGALVLAMIVSLRVKVMVLGGSSHAASTDARIQQYAMGIPKLLKWPFGYGIGMAGTTLDFQMPNGQTTIDTYYLSVLLEYGVAGFIVYFGMFLTAIYEAARRNVFMRIEDEDKSFLLPISLSLIVFVLSKAVFSQADIHPIVFMMVGAVLALCAQRQKPKAMPAVGNRGRSSQFRKSWKLRVAR
jgi:hypothetical protein